MTRLVHRLLFNLLLPVLASAGEDDCVDTVYVRAGSVIKGGMDATVGLTRPPTSAASTSPRTVPGPTTAGSATTSRSPYRLYATVDGCDQSKATAVPTHHRLVVGDGCPKPSSSFS
ncbi:hypothetical protein OPV22_029034 [Ensete ventricosum]|uniref:Uncharacterized protein n=1 Tax=Ensete ventricosum TaxID=4639 RepID=A0AAV8P6W8_ENSVE|nr:hypothetical protein OPV22_029034 [Ensete ventricosum]